MYKNLVFFLFITIVSLLSWCKSNNNVEYNEELPYVQDTVEEISEPTTTTEIPENTNEEIFTQPDTNL